MKNAKTPMKSPKLHDAILDVGAVIKSLREAVLKALTSTNLAVRDCLAAGQALNEARDAFRRRRGEGGEFAEWDDGSGWQEFVEKNIPEVHYTTAWRWMAAAANVFTVVEDKTYEIGDSPGDRVIDVEGIPVSEMLNTPDDELPEGAREWKQAWFDFTANKTIKQCLAGVFVDGDGDARASHVFSGLTSPRAGGGGDRKDFADFTLRKLKHISTFFGSWEGMPERQRTEIKDEFTAAICGEEYKLRGRPGDDHRVPVRFEAWPEDVCLVALEAIKARLKKTR